MFTFLRKVRKQLLATGNTQRYLLYAIGEIALVVIGILIALQIDNWNDQRKTRADENYILREIAANLKSDGELMAGIIAQRQKVKAAVDRVRADIQDETLEEDSLAADLALIFTFERYFPIRTAYEVAKTKGLPITNESLRSDIANYYEFEQNLVQRSIEDIEKAFAEDFVPGIEIYLLEYVYNSMTVIRNYRDPEFVEWLRRTLVSFKDNNAASLIKMRDFAELNRELQALMREELAKF